ncbi:MAG: hypothetical protein JWN51_3732 [Phycisphaerales bacterium]|nr:hypothetical protein [Phycisphaerales bacterium]
MRGRWCDSGMGILPMVSVLRDVRSVFGSKKARAQRLSASMKCRDADDREAAKGAKADAKRSKWTAPSTPRSQDRQGQIRVNAPWHMVLGRG